MKRHALLSLVAGLVLAACSSAPPPPSGSTLFVPDRAYGSAPPPGAATVTNAELEELVRSGQATLVTPANTESRSEFEARAAAGLATLQALPDKSEALQEFLNEPPDATLTANGDYIATPTKRDGTTFDVTTLGPAAVARILIEADAQLANPANLLANYRSTHEVLDPSVTDGLPTPESLEGRPIAELRVALAQLEQKLALLNSSEIEGAEDDGSAALEPTSAGNGNDRQAGEDCSFNATGLMKKVTWPLKPFLQSVKQQGSRGTCWAFSSIGAIELRERVVNGRTVNLSEQHFNHLRKLNGDQDEGDWVDVALNDIAGRGVKLATEDHWTYNTSSSRGTEGQKDVCKGYDGYCSETVHQSPQSCSQFLGLWYCANRTVTYSGSLDIKASNSSVVWSNTSGAAFPTSTVKSLLSSGQPVIASIDTRPSFNNGGRDGWVTGLSGRSGGGHAILIVGYVSDAVAQKFASPPAMTGGTGGGWFVIKNSWGCDWGDGGYAYLPVRYMQRNAWSIAKLTMSKQRTTAFRNHSAKLKGVPPLPTAPVVNGVGVTASSTSVASGGTATLTAVVSGSGSFDGNVTWQILSGGGTLSSTTGNTVLLTAPTGPATVTVRATSVADTTRWGDVTVNVAAPVANAAFTLTGTSTDLPDAAASARVTVRKHGTSDSTPPSVSFAGTVSGDGFTVDLPGSVAALETVLTTVSATYSRSGTGCTTSLTIGDLNARIATASTVEVFDAAQLKVGGLTNASASTPVAGGYDTDYYAWVFSDRPTTVSGSTSCTAATSSTVHQYDLNLAAGWNPVRFANSYRPAANSSPASSTTVATNVTMAGSRWVVALPFSLSVPHLTVPSGRTTVLDDVRVSAYRHTDALTGAVTLKLIDPPSGISMPDTTMTLDPVYGMAEGRPVIGVAANVPSGAYLLDFAVVTAVARTDLQVRLQVGAAGSPIGALVLSGPMVSRGTSFDFAGGAVSTLLFGTSGSESFQGATFDAGEFLLVVGTGEAVSRALSPVVASIAQFIGCYQGVTNDVTLSDPATVGTGVAYLELTNGSNTAVAFRYGAVTNGSDVTVDGFTRFVHLYVDRDVTANGTASCTSNGLTSTASLGNVQLESGWNTLKVVAAPGSMGTTYTVTVATDGEIANSRWFY